MLGIGYARHHDVNTWTGFGIHELLVGFRRRGLFHQLFEVKADQNRFEIWRQYTSMESTDLYTHNELSSHLYTYINSDKLYAKTRALTLLIQRLCRSKKGCPGFKRFNRGVMLTL
jgi:hypothetical protein